MKNIEIMLHKKVTDAMLRNVDSIQVCVINVQRKFLDENFRDKTILKLEELCEDIRLYSLLDEFAESLESETVIEHALELEIDLNLTNQNKDVLVEISLKKDTSSKHTYILTMKNYDKCVNKEEICELTDIDEMIGREFEFGDISIKSNFELIKLLSDVDYFKSKLVNMTYDEYDYFRYLIGIELTNRIEFTNQINRNLQLVRNTQDFQSLSKFFNEDDLHFSTDLIAFNCNDHSYILNKIQGQGETFYELKQLDEVYDFVELDDLEE